MVYRRRTNKGRKLKSYRKRQPLALKAYKLAKKAYKAPELKLYELGLIPSSASGTGSIHDLTAALGQGTSNNQRIGDTILPTSVKYRMTLKIGASATDTLIRMIVFRWISEEPSTAADVLTTATVNSFKSENQRYQSQILRDQTFRLSTIEKPELFIRGSVKLRKPISFPGGTTTANRNAVYMLFVSDEAVNTPSINLTTRVYYKDS